MTFDPKPTDRDQVWQVIPETGACVTYHIFARSGVVFPWVIDRVDSPGELIPDLSLLTAEGCVNALVGMHSTPFYRASARRIK